MVQKNPDAVQSLGLNEGDTVSFVEIHAEGVQIVIHRAAKESTNV